MAELDQHVADTTTARWRLMLTGLGGLAGRRTRPYPHPEARSRAKCARSYNVSGATISRSKQPDTKVHRASIATCTSRMKPIHHAYIHR